MGRSQEIANLQVGLDMDMQSFTRELSNAKKNVRNLSKDFDIASKSIDNAEDKVEAYSKALQKGNKAFGATEKKLQMQNKQFDDLYKRTEKQKKQYDELSDELKIAEKALADMAKNGDKSSSAYKEQEKSVKDLKKALSDKLELVQKNSHKLQQYSTDIDRTSNDLNKLKNSMDDLKQGMDGIGEGSDELALIGDNAEKTGISLDNLALGAKASAIAIASVFAKNVYDGAIAFDDAITGLRLSLGLAEKDAKALYEQINAISGDGGYSLEGVSEAVTLLEKRFNLTDAETKNLAQSMDLLAKMGYESADVTRFMTSAVNDWGMSHSDALDMIIAGEQSGLNISQDWLDTLVEYTPILSTLGVKGEEAFALVDEAVNATGMTTDQAMDMVKEFFLTLTDGSTTSKDAFADLGINIEDLKTKINDGSITSVDAMQQVMTAIMGVGDETERARLLQEIFKGTIEYGSEGVVEAWSNMEGAVKNTAGAMDEAKQAYESSYQAMQQDLSNEWNELTQTIGSKAIPALISIVDTTTKVVETMGIFPQAIGRFFTQIKNDIANAMDGGYGAVLEFVSNSGYALADLADGMGLDGWADSIRERMKPVDAEHEKIVDNIRRREQETSKVSEEYAKQLEQIWNDTELEPKVNTENVKQQVVELTKTYEEIPKDVRTVLKADSEESKAEALKVYNLYKQLPPEVQTEIKADNFKALEGAKTVEDVLKNLNKGESTTKINVDTGDSKYKVQDVKKEVSSVDGKVSKVTFHTETAQASKNVTGLKKNISDYDKKNTGKTKTTKFNTITAQASKNVTGLKNNVSSFVRNYCKTFTTTFKVVTKYSTQGSPTPQSSGTKPTVRTIVPRRVANVESLQTRAIKTFEPYADNMPIMRSAMARVSQPTLDIDTLLRNTTRSNLRATQNTPIAIGDIADGLEFDIELLKELEAQLKLVSNQLSILDKKAEESTGQDKINYIKQQNQLYEEQQGILKKQEEYLQRQQNYVKYSLENRGIKFNSDNNMTNYEEMLLKKEKEVKALEQKANKDKAPDSDKKKYESAKSALDDLKKYADEYYSLTFDELPKVKEEWEDLANSIRENAHALKDLEREQALYTKNSKLKEISVFQDEIAYKQDLINEKMKHASGEEKVKYYKQLIALSETDMKHQELKIKTYKDSLAVLQQEMKGFGFTFDTNGSMENIDEVLNKFQNSKDLEYVKKLMEEYITMQRNDLHEAEKNWQEMANSITDAKNAITDFNKEADKFRFDMAFVSAQKHVDELNNALEMLDVRLENAFGENKSELLQEKVDLLHKQKQEMLDVINLLKKSKTDLQGKLSNQGFKITDNGSIANYDSQMEKLKKSMSADDFAEIEQLTKSYLDLLVKELPEAERKWTDLDNAIIEHQNQLEKVQRQIKLDPYLNKIKEIENELDKLADKLDIIDIKLENAWGQDKLDLLTKQIDLLEEQSKKQQEIVKQYEDMRGVYQNDLIEFGVKFDKDGDITNLDEILNKYQSHRDIEKLKELIDEYLNIQSDKLPDAVKEWEKLNSAIKDAYKEQLEVVKDIEDEITKVYKKQVQDRIDLINKELDSRLDALGKEKKAYDDARKEADYKRDYEDQLAVVTELQKKIDIASKDTSLAGQKKLQELLDQLKEEQRNLEDMVQDNIDDQVNDMFDKESDRLTGSAEDAIEDLEDKFSDSKIAELVAQALGSGVFTDIEGNVSSLEDALVDFAKETGDLFGVLGSTIEQELIGKLKEAIDTFGDLDDILDKLGTNSRTGFSIPNVDYSSSRYTPSSSNNSTTNNSNNRTVEVNFNQPLVKVEGNVSEDIMPQVEAMVKEAKEDVVRSIVREIR